MRSEHVPEGCVAAARHVDCITYRDGAHGEGFDLPATFRSGAGLHTSQMRVTRRSQRVPRSTTAMLRASASRDPSGRCSPGCPARISHVDPGLFEREYSVKDGGESLDGLRLGLVRNYCRFRYSMKEDDMFELTRGRSSRHGRSRLAGCVCPLRLTVRIVPTRAIARGAQWRRAVEIH
jgi:hypothetical protein